MDEYGFNIDPKVGAINFGLTLNSLDLTVVGEDKKVVEVLGFCGYKTWIKSAYNVPKHKEGSLKVVGDLEAGIGSYRINKKEFPVYVNTKTGWICIGDPEKKGSAVEFINNCVAIIDDNSEFISLWIKPELLPPNI